MPKSIPYKVLKILGPMMETHICKIECKDGGHGTGFFCNIPYDWGILKVLMTNNHVLNKDDILPNKKINFSINDEKIHYEIEIDNSRKTYTNKDYDVTIIEIKENDKLDKNSFFDIDNQIFNKNIIEIYRNMQIYLLHYPKGEQMEYSIGIIKNICADKYNIHHLCNSNSGSSGGPIINSMNFQVLGIHKGGAGGAKNYNVGTLLKEPIENFNEENNKKEKLNKAENKKNKENKIKDNNEKKEEINESENKEELNDEIKIQYNIKDIEYSKDIRIFGDEFVKNNKYICKIIINKKEFELYSHLNNNLNDAIIEIKLKGINKINNISNMFKGEYNLLDIIIFFT